MAKLHPHLKHFIHSVILTELNESIGPSKKYEYKEAIMREVQQMIIDRIDEVQNQQELSLLVDNVVLEFKKKQIEPLLEMISRVIKQVPLDVLKKK